MKRKISIGQAISIIGILILCVGLICNSFEIVPDVVFRIIVLVGIITEVVAVFFILKKSEL